MIEEETKYKYHMRPVKKEANATDTVSELIYLELYMKIVHLWLSAPNKLNVNFCIWFDNCPRRVHAWRSKFTIVDKLYDFFWSVEWPNGALSRFIFRASQKKKRGNIFFGNFYIIHMKRRLKVLLNTFGQFSRCQSHIYSGSIKLD